MTRSTITPRAGSKRRSPALLWALVITCCAAALGSSGWWAWTADTTAEQELASFRTLSSQAQELVHLRTGSQPQLAAAKAESGLASRMTAALSACGLPSSVLSSFSADATPASATPSPASLVSSAASSHTQLIRRRANLTLAGLTLPQLGKVLAAWRDKEPAWVVTSIDLGPQPGAAPSAGPGSDLPLRAGIVLEAMVLETSGGGR